MRMTTQVDYFYVSMEVVGILAQYMMVHAFCQATHSVNLTPLLQTLKRISF